MSRVLNPSLTSEHSPRILTELRMTALPGPNSFAAATRSLGSPSQSDIWSVDPSNMRIRPSWINTDGNVAEAAKFAYVPDSGAFALVGDLKAFRKRYGDAWETVRTTASTAYIVRDLEADDMTGQTFTFEPIY